MPKNKNNSNAAFTIVELLIVIVIIGILAAITVVSYTGITARANQTTLISDLATAKKQFELYKADHGVYPTGLEIDTNCLTGTTSPSPDTRYCLKSSGGSAYVLEDVTGSDYTLKLTKGTIAYKITKDLAPTSTTATVVTFAKAWGGSNGEYAWGLIQTVDSGYVVSGYTNSFGAGSNDAFLAKYDSSGSLSWSKTWGGGGSDVNYGGLIQTGDGGYIISGCTTSFGSGDNDAFLAKYDSSGSLSWSKTWGGGGSDIGTGLVKTSDGGYVMSGYTTSFGSGSNDVFLAKYDSAGNLTWSKTWGGSSSDINQGGLIQVSDNGYVVSGYTSSYGTGSNDVFLAKFDSSGNLVWNKIWGGTSDDINYSGLVQTGDGGYVVSGWTYSYGYGAGTSDVFLIKYDSSGNLTWNKTWGGAGNDVNYGGLIQTSDSGYTMSGWTSSYGSGAADAFQTKYDTSGSLVWSKTWGGAGNDYGYNLAKTNDGGYIMSGSTTSYGGGNDDALFLKTNSSGAIANCNATMCQSPTATVTSPTTTVSSPTATVSSPTAAVTSPSATVTSPSATSMTIVAAP